MLMVPKEELEVVKLLVLFQERVDRQQFIIKVGQQPVFPSTFSSFSPAGIAFPGGYPNGGSSLSNYIDPANYIIGSSGGGASIVTDRHRWRRWYSSSITITSGTC